MRDIKFKVWRKDDNKMYGPDEHFLIYTDGLIPAVDAGTPFRDYPLEGAVLLQFTGLKDKTGKEVYEGDIITHSVDNMVGAVTWSEGLYRFVIEKGDEIIADLCDYDFEPEVIGNIYENPERLNG